MVGEDKDYSGMTRCLFVILEVIKRAGHAEMESQPNFSIGAHKEVFAMTAARFEEAAFQSARKRWRRDVFQDVFVPHVDVVDPLMQRGGIEVSLEYFNVRQLWHRS